MWDYICIYYSMHIYKLAQYYGHNTHIFHDSSKPELSHHNHGKSEVGAIICAKHFFFVGQVKKDYLLQQSAGENVLAIHLQRIYSITWWWYMGRGCWCEETPKIKSKSKKKKCHIIINIEKP